MPVPRWKSPGGGASPAPLNSLFRRDYSALYKAVKHFFQPSSVEQAAQEQLKQEQHFSKVIASVVPPPALRPFQLFCLDVTPVPRPYAQTLADRTFVYQPNTIRGNKPVNIGHPYSILSILPERVHPNDAPWAIPLSGLRVSSTHTGYDVGNDQVNTVLSNPSLPWHKQFCVLVVDSSYSPVRFLGEQVQHENLVTVVRVRGNRVFYQSPTNVKLPRHRGRPLRYKERSYLGDETTWHDPDETQQATITTCRGRLLYVTVNAWHQMLMRGTKDYPMHLHPFT